MTKDGAGGGAASYKNLEGMEKKHKVSTNFFQSMTFDSPSRKSIQGGGNTPTNSGGNFKPFEAAKQEIQLGSAGFGRLQTILDFRLQDNDVGFMQAKACDMHPDRLPTYQFRNFVQSLLQNETIQNVTLKISYVHVDTDISSCWSVFSFL